MAKKILISAGHSTVKPVDPGAVGNGFAEAYLALELRDLVSEKLQKRGVHVIEDGDDGINLPLRKAIALAKTADIAIEFHWNAGPPAATGIEVLSKPDKKPLAKKLAAAIHDATKLKLRGDAGWKSDSSGQHHRLAFCEAGGLIVEVCFISSKVDMAAYTSAKDRVAENIANVLAPAQTQPDAGKGAGVPFSSAVVPADEPTDSASADSSAQDPPNPLPETEQPPIIVEEKTELTQTNQQDVSQAAEVKAPEPQGIFTKLSAGISTLVGGTVVWQAFEKLGGITFTTTAIAVVCFVVFIAFLAFCFWAWLDAWKQKNRVQVEADAKTAIDRKDIVWK